MNTDGRGGAGSNINVLPATAAGSPHGRLMRGTFSAAGAKQTGDQKGNRAGYIHSPSALSGGRAPRNALRNAPHPTGANDEAPIEMTSRLTLSIHMLGLMAWCDARGCAAATSEQMARSINTNPVVVRRLLVDLRRAGLVETKRGAGGGARLGRAPERITLRDVYEAVEEREPLFALHPNTPDACCVIGGHIDAYLRGVYDEAEEALKQRLASVSIRDVCEALAACPGRRAVTRG